MINENQSGVLFERKRPQELIGGSTTPLEILNENGDWTNFLPEHEHQQRYGYETWSCIIHNAGNDAKETIMNFKIKNNLIKSSDVRWLTENGYIVNGKLNFDDRIPSMFADIKKNFGTYVYKGLDACAEWNLPEGFLKDNPKTFEEWINKERLTDEARELNDQFNKRFSFKWWWLEEKPDGGAWEDDVDEKLKSSPIGMVVRYADGEGCLNPIGQTNHSVLDYKKGECYPVNDSYNQEFKHYNKKHPVCFNGWTLINKTMARFKPENNKLYLLVEGKEQVLAMGLDGRLVVYNDKIDALINSASRSKAYQIPTPITMEMFNGCDRVNGKGELLYKFVE